MSNNIRIEEDRLGTREAPSNTYDGIYTITNN